MDGPSQTQFHVAGALLSLCVALFLALIVESSKQPACFPWPDHARVEKMSCYNATGHENPTGRWQTISEMTARSGLTAELLSAFAAFSLVSIAHALSCLHRATLYNDARDNWTIVNVTYAVGALGFVGLTVWNLRVESTVHTCFTSQTVVAVFAQIVALTCLRKKIEPKWWLKVHYSVAGLLFLAMATYVGLLAKNNSPPLIGGDYFDEKYYTHAFPQYTFFGLYFVALILFIVDAAQSQDNTDAAQSQDSQGEFVTNPVAAANGTPVPDAAELVGPSGSPPALFTLLHRPRASQRASDSASGPLLL